MTTCITFQQEWNGLTLDVEADLTPGVPTSINHAAPELSEPGHGPELQDLRVFVNGKEFDVAGVRYEVDVSHMYATDGNGGFYWKFNKTPVSFGVGRLRALPARKTRAVYGLNDEGKRYKVGEETYSPVLETRILEDELAARAVEEYQN